MMNRESALELIKEHLKTDNLVKHSIATEACMRKFAEVFGEDKDIWGLAGLLHDLDYEYTLEYPDNHGLKTEEMLKNCDVPSEVVHSIKAHNLKAPLESKMDKALYAIDPTTGFITAVALMHPDKSFDVVTLKRMKKRFKEKNFARGACREQMKSCESLEMPLEDFLTRCLEGMVEFRDELGL